MLDHAIIGGTVYDGTGSAGRRADVGVVDGRVSAITDPGQLPAARHCIDATERIVTPGFVDPHTHLDAQLWWDPSGAPSVEHGVTTVVIGSCGFGVAPAAAGASEFLLRSLEAVEEIPYSVTAEAVPSVWASWGQFFEGLGAEPLGVNVAGLVPHSTTRLGVVGIDGREQTLDAAQLDDLAAMLEAALDTGALGVSTSRGSNHVDFVGRPVTTRFAADEEIQRLAAVAHHRVMQINIASKGPRTHDGVDAALAELRNYYEWAHEHDARLTWTPLVVPPGDTLGWRRILGFVEASAHEAIAPQVSPQPVVAAIVFNGPTFAAMIDGWGEVFSQYGGISSDERRVRLASADARERLRLVGDHCDAVTSPCFDRWTVALSPSRPGLVGRTVRELGRDEGRHPVDALFDLVLNDDLETVIEVPMSNIDTDAVSELVCSPATMLGLGDAGAHVTTITNYSYPTTLLADYVVRRRLLPVETAVWKLTGQPAAFLGLRDRGRLQEGGPADVCVVDLDGLALRPAEVVHDLPGGAARLYRGAAGYDAVLVNGILVVEHDSLTLAPAGKLLRGTRR